MYMYFTVVSGDHHILSVSVAKQQIFKTDMSTEVSVTVFVQIHIFNHIQCSLVLNDILPINYFELKSEDYALLHISSYLESLMTDGQLHNGMSFRTREHWI
jgi:hypothetical protein